LAGAAALVLTSANEAAGPALHTKRRRLSAYLKGRLIGHCDPRKGSNGAIEQFAAPSTSIPSTPSPIPLLQQLCARADAGARRLRHFMPRAKAAAVRALEIDDTLLEALASCLREGHYTGTVRGAEPRASAILKFEPKTPCRTSGTALLLADAGESPKAIAQAGALSPPRVQRRAASERTSPRSCTSVVVMTRRNEEARNATRADPESAARPLRLGLALEQQGRMQTPWPHSSGVAVSCGTIGGACALGHSYARSARRTRPKRFSGH